MQPKRKLRAVCLLLLLSLLFYHHNSWKSRTSKQVTKCVSHLSVSVTNTWDNHLFKRGCEFGRKMCYRDPAMLKRGSWGGWNQDCTLVWSFQRMKQKINKIKKWLFWLTVWKIQSVFGWPYCLGTILRQCHSFVNKIQT